MTVTPVSELTFKDLCLDALRPDVVAPFWAGLLGLDGERRPAGDHVLRGADLSRTIWVNGVGEPHQVEDRVHLDVRFPDGRLPAADVLRPTGTVVRQRPDTPYAWLEEVPGFPYMFWVSNAVPEPKAAKNRMHGDVTLTGTTVDGLVANGATVLRARDEEIGWAVLDDPEGNEFCAFAPAG